MSPVRATLLCTLLALPVLVAGSASAFPPVHRAATSVITPPPPGQLYHGVYPGGRNVAEHEIGPQHLRSYEDSVGGHAAWVYFTEEWYDGLRFPRATADWIRAQGRVPFIRMTPRAEPEMELTCESPSLEPAYPLSDILGTRFDAELGRWMADARDFGWPLLVEFGTEMNGAWFPWSGKWNGGAATTGYGDPALPDGPERFRDSFRKLVRIAADSGATNITWVFHVASESCPDEPWNQVESYYPGPDSVGWLAVSVYGPQEAADNDYVPFQQRFAPIHQRLVAMDSTKPIVVAELGAKKDGSAGTLQARWAGGALDYLLQSTPRGVIGFSWWNSAFNDGGRLIDMRVQTSLPLRAVMRQALNDPRVLQDPIIVATPP
jgi:hypothetical protein